MSKVQDEYYLDRVIESENAVVRVYRPVLTEEERARRMEEFKKVVERFMKAVIKAEMETQRRKEGEQQHG